MARDFRISDVWYKAGVLTKHVHQPAGRRGIGEHFLTLVKYALQYLGVPYLDPCCLTESGNGQLVGALNSVVPTGATQAVTGTGALAAINLTSYVSSYTTTGAATSTLAVATTKGLRKKIRLAVDGGDLVVTVASLTGGTTITFNDAGDYVELIWNGTNWLVLENSGTTIA